MIFVTLVCRNQEFASRWKEKYTFKASSYGLHIAEFEYQFMKLTSICGTRKSPQIDKDKPVLSPNKPVLSPDNPVIPDKPSFLPDKPTLSQTNLVYL